LRIPLACTWMEVSPRQYRCKLSQASVETRRPTGQFSMTTLSSFNLLACNGIKHRPSTRRFRSATVPRRHFHQHVEGHDTAPADEADYQRDPRPIPRAAQHQGPASWVCFPAGRLLVWRCRAATAARPSRSTRAVLGVGFGPSCTVDRDTGFSTWPRKRGPASRGVETLEWTSTPVFCVPRQGVLDRNMRHAAYRRRRYDRTVTCETFPSGANTIVARVGRSLVKYGLAFQRRGVAAPDQF